MVVVVWINMINNWNLIVCKGGMLLIIKFVIILGIDISLYVLIELIVGIIVKWIFLCIVFLEVNLGVVVSDNLDLILVLFCMNVWFKFW